MRETMNQRTVITKRGALKEYLRNTYSTAYAPINILPVYVVSNNIFSIGHAKFLVVTSKEARELAAEYIKENIYCLDYQFILDHSACLKKLEELYGNPARTINRVQRRHSKCANELIKEFIDDIDSFIEDAIKENGISAYIQDSDGVNEGHVCSNGPVYRIYRVD